MKQYNKQKSLKPILNSVSMAPLLKLLGRQHVTDILGALASHRDSGLTFSEIQFEFVKSSSTNLLLKVLVENHLVNLVDKKYFITKEGEIALSYTQNVDKILAPPISNGVSDGK